MKKNKNRIIENIEILDFAAEGKCIVKNDGEVIFVEGSNVCPGDEVKMVVSKSKKKFSEGRILAINKFNISLMKNNSNKNKSRFLIN
jgi:23S rRNA (uracil1939-C5)-methyltransferase